MRKSRFSERQIDFIPTKAAAGRPRDGTTCCRLLTFRAHARTKPVEIVRPRPNLPRDRHSAPRAGETMLGQDRTWRAGTARDHI
jgi:hypothetical protein